MHSTVYPCNLGGTLLKAFAQRCRAGALVCLGFAACQPAISAGQFSINIDLTGAGQASYQQLVPGICLSQNLSAQTNAVVRVVCATGQFVSISANPVTQFLGTHGGAFRYILSPEATYLNSQLNEQGSLSGFYPGTGTVTAWRSYNADGSLKLLEMLLSF